MEDSDVGVMETLRAHLAKFIEDQIRNEYGAGMERNPEYLAWKKSRGLRRRHFEIHEKGFVALPFAYIIFEFRPNIKFVVSHPTPVTYIHRPKYMSEGSKLDFIYYRPKDGKLNLWEIAIVQKTVDVRQVANFDTMATNTFNDAALYRSFVDRFRDIGLKEFGEKFEISQGYLEWVNRIELPTISSFIDSTNQPGSCPIMKIDTPKGRLVFEVNFWRSVPVFESIHYRPDADPNLWVYKFHKAGEHPELCVNKWGKEGLKINGDDQKCFAVLASKL